MYMFCQEWFIWKPFIWGKITENLCNNGSNNHKELSVDEAEKAILLEYIVGSTHTPKTKLFVSYANQN